MLQEISRDTLFLVGRISKQNKENLEVSVETYVSIFVLAYCKNNCLDICFVDLDGILPCSVPISAINNLHYTFLAKESSKTRTLNCCLPAIQSSSKQIFVGGLCAVLRWTLKVLIENHTSHPCQSLLGFRGGCLVACSESSVWTKFCEVELPKGTKELASIKSEGESLAYIPESLAKLEAHLKRPVRTHNILKRKLDLAKKVRKDFSAQTADTSKLNSLNSLDQTDIDFTLYSKTKSTDCAQLENLQQLLKDVKITEANEDFHLEHCYLEGIDLTLADVVVLPCVHYLLKNLPLDCRYFVPHVVKWYTKMLLNTPVKNTAEKCAWSKLDLLCLSNLCELPKDIALPDINEDSLYSRDPSRGKLKCKHFDPTNIICILKEKEIVPNFKENKFIGLNWDSLPPALHPAYGDLPKKRIDRKCQQLESVVTAVLKIALPGQTIVEFCAGGGHVGLLLAYHLPDCKIILVENKEASMLRARKRAQAMEFNNIEFYQCNLDYFKGDFEIGVSLHACGVATDLVMQQCLAQNAAFVCCPCCYGGVQETHLLKYPLSRKVISAGISYQDFTLLAHCADRTEANTPQLQQGNYCMGLIDTDRLFYAEEHGYEIMLSTLQPVSCSPKHNLLIGIPCS